MKKRLLVFLCALTVVAGSVAGCGNADEQAQTTETEQAVEQNSVTEAAVVEETAETTVGMENPWVDITEDEANANCFRLFKAPDGAKDVVWSMCDELGDVEKGIGPMIQLAFTLDDVQFTARAQQGAAEDTDIAGNYVEWTVGPEEATLANWAEGNMPAKTYRSINESGYLDMITWYDIEMGISYSLSAAAADLDGFDIQAVAEQMY